MPPLTRCVIAAAAAFAFAPLVAEIQRLDRERNGVFIREANVRAH